MSSIDAARAALDSVRRLVHRQKPWSRTIRFAHLPAVFGSPVRRSLALDAADELHCHAFVQPLTTKTTTSASSASLRIIGGRVAPTMLTAGNIGVGARDGGRPVVVLVLRVSPDNVVVRSNLANYGAFGLADVYYPAIGFTRN